MSSETKADDLASLIVAIAAAMLNAAKTGADIHSKSASMPKHTRGRAQSIAYGLADDLRRLEAEIAVFQDVIVSAQLPEGGRFSLDSRTFLTKPAFERYKHSSGVILDLLHRLQKAALQLEGIAPHVYGPDAFQAQGLVEAVIADVRRVLREEDATLGEVLSRLLSIVGEVSKLLDSLTDQLREEPQSHTEPS